MRTTLAAALTMLLLPTAAFAQSIPSTDEVIRALRPGGPDATRGIRPVAPTPQAVAPARPAPPPSAAATASAPVAAPGLGSLDFPIQFSSGSDKLTPQAMKALDSLGQALVSPTLRADHFRIEGHTDTVGSAAANNELSARRAETVSKYLASRYNIETARLVAVGMGPSRLAVPTGEGVPEPRNRRVQIVNLGS